MNLYLYELKANLKSLIIWSICMVVLIVMGLEEQAGLASSGGETLELLNNMPKSLKALMGGGAFDPTTQIGYYSMIYMYLVLITVIHAFLLGAGMISKEERDRTYEFLMVKPTTRKNIMTSKILATSTNILIFNVVTLITSLILIDSSKSIIKLMFGMLLLQILFMSIGTILAAYRSKNTSIGIGIILIAFFLGIFIDMVEHIDFLRYLTPFKYFDAQTLIYKNGFNPILVVITLSISSLFIYLTYKIYQDRDLGH